MDTENQVKLQEIKLYLFKLYKESEYSVVWKKRIYLAIFILQIVEFLFDKKFPLSFTLHELRKAEKLFIEIIPDTSKDIIFEEAEKLERMR